MYQENLIQRVVDHFGCSVDDAVRYLDLRDEGYSSFQASVMAGIADPAEETE